MTHAHGAILFLRRVEQTAVRTDKHHPRTARHHSVNPYAATRIEHRAVGRCHQSLVITAVSCTDTPQLAIAVTPAEHRGPTVVKQCRGARAGYSHQCPSGYRGNSSGHRRHRQRRTHSPTVEQVEIDATAVVSQRHRRYASRPEEIETRRGHGKRIAVTHGRQHAQSFMPSP